MTAISVRPIVTLCAALGAGALPAALPNAEAVSWNWAAHPDSGTSVTNALDWFAPENWAAGVPVNDGLSRADFATGQPAATRYVVATQDVHLADLRATASAAFTTGTVQKVVLLSDSRIVFDDTSKTLYYPYQNGFMFYADVTWMRTIYPKSLIFCGEICTLAGATTSLPLANGNPIEIRGDLFASTANEVRTLAAGFQSMTINAGDLTLVAPRGSGEDVTGAWNQRKDSPFLFPAGAAHVLCAGTAVTGAGIPAGTFLKRIFPDGSIELSQPAGETVAGNALTFAAFSPKVTQSFSSYANQDNTTHYLRFMKWRAEDDFRVTITALTTVNPNIKYFFATKEGALPATTVLKSAAGMQGKLFFENSHVEFGVPGCSDSLAFAGGDCEIATATACARLAVSNGLSASLANFSKMIGTLVKEGDGALSLDLTGTAADYTGTFVAKGGSLTLAGANANEVSVRTLAVSNGATLCVPAQGIRCETLAIQPGARVIGTGTLTVTTFSEDLMNVTCTGGATVVYADEGRCGDIVIEPPATNVPGTPAVWFDASRLDSMAYAEEGGDYLVSQWRDVRGGDIMTATNTCANRKPRLMLGSDGTRNCVYFEKNGSTGSIADSCELGWKRRVTGICSVFKVIGARQGGGQFLGASSLWRNAEYASFSYPAFCDSANSVTDLLTGSRFMVNGELRDWKAGYAYPGSVAALLPEARIPQVVELHLADGQETYAQGFSAQENSAKGRNGNQDLYEIIVYTNRLTETERLAVTGYLMQKWLNAQANYETASDVESVPTLSAGQTLGVATGTKMAAENLSGEGVVSKTGGGMLYIADGHAPTTALRVAAGNVTVRSFSPTRETIPDGALLHLDASDAATYRETRTSGDVTYLTAWADARGDGYAPVLVSGSRTSSDNPKIVKNKLNGLAMVDFGAFGTYADNIMTCRVMTVRSFFTVQNSEKTGGYLFGDTLHNCYSAGETGYYGLIRYPVGSLTYPVIWSNYGNTVKQFGAGATKVRLNGEDVVGTSAYYTGENDLLTVQCYEGLSGNSISHGKCNGPVYGGGKMIGELLYFDRRLSNEDSRCIEAYLNQKWFGRETPGYRPARLAALEVAAGATLTVVGNAPVRVSSCSGGGTVSGGVAFLSDSDWTVAVGRDVVPETLTVTGTFDVTSVRSLVLTGTGKAPLGSYVLVRSGGLVGDVAALATDASGASPVRRYVLRRSGNDIVLDVMPKGLSVNIR